MKPIVVFAILCAFAPAVALAQDGSGKSDPSGVAAPRLRKTPHPSDIVAPGVLRQDLFDRNDPNNLRSDYPGPPAQPSQY